MNNPGVVASDAKVRRNGKEERTDLMYFRWMLAFCIPIILSWFGLNTRPARVSCKNFVGHHFDTFRNHMPFDVQEALIFARDG